MSLASALSISLRSEESLLNRAASEESCPLAPSACTACGKFILSCRSGIQDSKRMKSAPCLVMGWHYYTIVDLAQDITIHPEIPQRHYFTWERRCQEALKTRGDKKYIAIAMVIQAGDRTIPVEGGTQLKEPLSRAARPRKSLFSSCVNGDCSFISGMPLPE